MEQKSRPITPFFVFMKEIRNKGEATDSKKIAKLWAKLPNEKREVYEAEYKRKAEEFERYMEAQGFKSRKQSYISTRDFTPLGKSKPTHIRAKQVRIVCGNSRDVLPSSKAVYKGLARMLEPFIESIGKAIEDERKRNWEARIDLDMVCTAAAKLKAFDKINGKTSRSKF